ncbi:MAG: methyltransferase type 12 [Bacteroidetes bacterium B1(2017)]|nr:MAG: methyltransferase type 12 [Bacteroidetes bacterium B1(2017)]
MKTEQDVKLDSYFNNRKVDPTYYSAYRIPRYLAPHIPTNKNAKILDIGCGYGQFLNTLKEQGYTNITGIDISNESINECKTKGLNAIQIEDIRDFSKGVTEKFDFITMSHVLEHIDKDKIIDTLYHIKKNLLVEGGEFILMVPNAQSYTGAYWRYEDFTHTIMFTSGSCNYVLKAAGFNTINFIDPDGTKHMGALKGLIIKTLIGIHKLREDFWNIVLQTSFHKPSPRIYSFEIKVSAK